MGKKRKQAQGTRVRKAVRAQEERISSRESIVERMWGIGTAVTAWGRRTEVGTPKRAVS